MYKSCRNSIVILEQIPHTEKMKKSCGPISC